MENYNNKFKIVSFKMPKYFEIYRSQEEMLFGARRLSDKELFECNMSVTVNNKKMSLLGFKKINNELYGEFISQTKDIQTIPIELIEVDQDKFDQKQYKVTI